MITRGLAEREDQGSQDNSGTVAVAELVEPGRDRAELLEVGEASFDDLAVAVGDLIEGRPPRAPRRRRFAAWSRRSGIVAAMPRRLSR